MDIRRYIELKEKGLTELQLTATGAILIQEQFDIETGERLEPNQQPVFVEDLENEIFNLEKQLNALMVLKEDILDLF